MNGKEEPVSQRVKRIIEIIRERTKGVEVRRKDSGEKIFIDRETLLKKDLMIISENNFATASGLASSSSGLSCLSFALA